MMMAVLLVTLLLFLSRFSQAIAFSGFSWGAVFGVCETTFTWNLATGYCNWAVFLVFGLSSVFFPFFFIKI